MKSTRLLKSLLSLTLVAVILLPIFAGCKKPSSSEPITGTEQTNPNEGTNNDIFSSIFKEEAIPTIHISTEKNFEVRSKTYFDANIRLELNERYAQYTSTYTDEDGGGMQIKCRGNSTFGAGAYTNKWSYKIKLDNKANMLGMGESRHWYLLANWFDVSAMRNKLAYDLSGSLGMTYTQSTWVIVYYNGEYRGLYQLCETVSIGEGRIESFDWDDFIDGVADMYALKNNFSEEDRLFLRTSLKKDLGWISGAPAVFERTEAIYNKKTQTYKYEVISSEKIDVSEYFDKSKLDLTSGYLIEYDNRLDSPGTTWRTNMGIPVMPANLEYLETNKEMYDYVKTLIQDFEDALLSPTFYNDKGKHYSEYLDVDSLVDFWIIWTVFNNIEFGVLSLFYYIDDGKIIFGPCWDFDNASGNIVTLNETWERSDTWTDDRGAGWFTTIFKDPHFTSLAQERYFEMRPLLDDMMQSLDVYHYYISEEAIKCYERNGPRTNWYLHNRNGGKSYDFQTDFELLKNWLTDHINWLDENFSAQLPNVDDNGYAPSDKVTMTLRQDGKTANTDRITSYGVKSNYIIKPNKDGKLDIKVINGHTTATNSTLFVNGKMCENKKTPTNTAVMFNIDINDLRTAPGELNTFYLVLYREDGSVRTLKSITARVLDIDVSTAAREAAVTFGDYSNIVVVEKGSTLKTPEITEKKEGFKALGWTTGDDKVYKPGEEIEIKNNTYFYIRWERTDMNSFMTLYRN